MAWGQFVRSCFLIEEINTTHTGVVTFDNLWPWDRYFGALSFTLRVTVDTLSYSSRHVNHCSSTIIKPFHSNHVTDILKIDVTSFHIFIFFHNNQSGHFEQYKGSIFPYRKASQPMLENLKSCQNKSIQCVFSNFLDKSKKTVLPSPISVFSFLPR